MSIKFLIFLLCGSIAMFFPIWIMGKSKNTPLWKSICITILLTLTGTLGTMLMFFVECGHFGGISFYGAVFFVPMIFPLIALLFKKPYGEVMDLCAAGECVMLVLMKVHCILSGCCIGRVLFNSNGNEIRFPSRTVEMIMAAVIFIVLFVWFKQGKQHGTLYAWYMILYGSTRFVLNLLREHGESDLILPIGNIWSLVAIVCGLLWLFAVHYIQVSKNYTQLKKDESVE